MPDLTPRVQAADQATQTLRITNAVYGSQIDVFVNDAPTSSANVSTLLLRWTAAGNTTGFGNLNDGAHRFWVGDFSGAGKSEVLFYFANDGNWWLGTESAGALSWKLLGNTTGFGNLNDGAHLFWVGDFSGAGKSQVLFYSANDSNWWLGSVGAGALTWQAVGNTTGFGNLNDGAHLLWVGDFGGGGKSQVLFYFANDNNWWLGSVGGGALSWQPAGNTTGFGNLNDGAHLFWVSDFSGAGRSQVLFYFANDRNWWLGNVGAGAIDWQLAGNSRGFGSLNDGAHLLWVGDFGGAGRSQVLFYFQGDGMWWQGLADQAPIPISPQLVPGDRITATQSLAGVTSGTSPATLVSHDWVTEHYDNARTGWNQDESVLTRTALETTPPHALFSHPLDDQAYAQPLYVSGLQVPGKGQHNVVVVATEGGTVYAFDADSSSPPNDAPLWQRSLVPSGESPVPISEVDGCDNIAPRICITGTPVIDRAANALYVVAKTMTNPAPPGAPSVIYRLHALDVQSGAERPESPVVIEGSAAGRTFDARFANQRGGLLVNNGNLYVPFASHCDRSWYYGWVFAYQASNLQRLATYNTCPVNTGGGIWQSGVGPAADSEGNLYALVGNGPFKMGGPDLGNSVLKLRADLTLADYFTPANQMLLAAYDWDLGSGAAIVLPDQAAGRHLLWSEDFVGTGGRQLLLANSADGNWWLGSFSGTTLAWSQVGNTSGFANLASAAHMFWTGDFSGAGKTELLMYNAGDGNWWLGSLSSASLTWTQVGNTSAFGNLADGAHVFWPGDFSGAGRTELLFYFPGDSNWWLGSVSGASLSWTLRGNTGGFGNLADGNHAFWAGDFTGGGKTEILVYSSGDGSWELGTLAGPGMNWTAVGNTSGFGNLADGKHIFWTGDFSGAHSDQVLFYFAQDNNWWLGTVSGTTLSWALAGNTTSFGDLADGRHLLMVADYTGAGQVQVLFNNADDGNWWLGSFSGASLAWAGVGNTSSFGDLADGRHLFSSGAYSSSAEAEVLVYYAGDGSWSLGRINAGILQWTTAAPSTAFGDLIAAQHLLLACGKQGIIYLLDRDNLGKYRGPGYTGPGSNDAVLQAVLLQPGKTPTAPGLPKGQDNQPGTWGGPAYYGGPEGQMVYYCGNTGPLTAFRLDGELVRAQESAQTFWSGATPVVTSQRGSAGTAVVWLLARANPLKLNAFDAGDVSHRLFEGVAGPWNNPKGAAFLEPTVIGGKAYTASATQLTVFGL